MQDQKSADVPHVRIQEEEGICVRCRGDGDGSFKLRIASESGQLLVRARCTDLWFPNALHPFEGEGVDENENEEKGRVADPTVGDLAEELRKKLKSCEAALLRAEEEIGKNSRIRKRYQHLVESFFSLEFHPLIVELERCMRSLSNRDLYWSPGGGCLNEAGFKMAVLATLHQCFQISEKEYLIESERQVKSEIGETGYVDLLITEEDENSASRTIVLELKYVPKAFCSFTSTGELTDFTINGKRIKAGEHCKQALEQARRYGRGLRFRDPTKCRTFTPVALVGYGSSVRFEK